MDIWDSGIGSGNFPKISRITISRKMSIQIHPEKIVLSYFDCKEHVKRFQHSKITPGQVPGIFGKFSGITMNTTIVVLVIPEPYLHRESEIWQPYISRVYEYFESKFDR
jgi:hypothetical protein